MTRCFRRRDFIRSIASSLIAPSFQHSREGQKARLAEQFHKSRKPATNRRVVMARPVTILPASLVWSGEHWVNFLREAGAESDSAKISFFHLRYSPAGEGNVAVVRISSQPGFDAVCTDNRTVVSFAVDFFFRKLDYYKN